MQASMLRHSHNYVLSSPCMHAHMMRTKRVCALHAYINPSKSNPTSPKHPKRQSRLKLAAAAEKEMAAAANNSSAAATNTFRLKLLINKRENKVLCAEAGKDFVDFLFNFTTLPVGAIVRLLKDSTPPAPGCVRQLCTSIENMNLNCFRSVQSKDYLVTKLRGETHVTKVPLLPTDTSPNRSMQRTIYSCNSNVHASRCLSLNYNSSVSPQGCYCKTQCSFTDNVGWCREADFVKGELRYLVMDDLSVLQFEYSMMSGVSILTTKFNVKDFSVIEEKVVQVGVNEGLELLRAFMHTKSALTTVFLGEKVTADVKQESCKLS